MSHAVGNQWEQGGLTSSSSAQRILLNASMLTAGAIQKVKVELSRMLILIFPNVFTCHEIKFQNVSNVAILIPAIFPTLQLSTSRSGTFVAGLDALGLCLLGGYRPFWINRRLCLLLSYDVLP